MVWYNGTDKVLKMNLFRRESLKAVGLALKNNPFDYYTVIAKYYFYVKITHSFATKAFFTPSQSFLKLNLFKAVSKELLYLSGCF